MSVSMSRTEAWWGSWLEKSRGESSWAGGKSSTNSDVGLFGGIRLPSAYHYIRKRTSSSVKWKGNGSLSVYYFVVSPVNLKKVLTMEQLDNVNTHLQAVLNKVDRDRTAEINKLKDEEQRLLDRLRDFEIEKEKAAAENGTLNVSDDDLIEINVGGKIIAAKRGTLCQWEGTRLEA
eukprot:scaffold16953_cov79-Skeletonema_dohrnii-CCMP3373.AAC.4